MVSSEKSPDNADITYFQSLLQHSPALSGTFSLHWASLTCPSACCAAFLDSLLRPCHSRSRRQQLSSSLPILAFPNSWPRGTRTDLLITDTSKDCHPFEMTQRRQSIQSRCPLTVNETLMSNKCGRDMVWIAPSSSRKTHHIHIQPTTAGDGNSKLQITRESSTLKILDKMIRSGS